METKHPDPNSRFAEVTRKAKEARAKKPQQSREDSRRTTVPAEERTVEQVRENPLPAKVIF